MESITQNLINLLNVQKMDEYLFQAQCTDLFGTHLFGGQILGQSLIAASKTTDRPAHSLHAYFIRSGRTDLPVLYKVENLRDGKSFATRQVYALQDGTVIFSAMISFAKPEQGLEYQTAAPEYPVPESFKSEQELKILNQNDIPEFMREVVMRQFDLRMHPVNPVNPFRPEKAEAEYAEYVQTFDKLTNEFDIPMFHQAILAYYSDYNLLTTSLRPHGISYANGGVRSASLDHAIYFHSEFRVDDWLLYDMHATRSSQSRGINYGQFWQNGKLVSSVTQESLMRVRP
ncbi:acyl-CoA thioesterase [Acinetobacter sp. WCHAc060025]|uniref:acyl-CoA thioesterase n=1 Tax=Acinetobacter sp. WCHAc060025 TaxID=2518625 RepID=UPI0010231A9D|nr:acyl-CoA thioesterase II [Acinetobacter sp. WCHAc060025]RZG72849.1 acyl-CoA thioesterase II [Acinetobacter sp. WCHAc060025]